VPSNDSPSFVKPLVVAIFFLSGAVGLLYEVLWTRQLALIFGVSTYAVAAVLATYMGGLALGSYWLGRWSDRIRNPLVTYAVLEIGIGLYALIVPTLFTWLRVPYVFLYGLELPAALLVIARVVLAAAVLLPPTTLMGGTFPILTRFWVSRADGVGLGAGLLYFVNTAGAICGCLFAGFYALEHFGVRGTSHLGVAVNMAVGVIALLLAARVRTPEPTAAAKAPRESAASTWHALQAPVWLVLVCVGLSGFTSLAYEVLWTRALLRILYNSTYAFTTMLSTFLAGIAAGSMLYVALLRRIRSETLLLAVLQVLVGLGFVVSAMLFANLQDLSVTIRGTEQVASFSQSVRMMFLNSALILFAPTIFLGATFPLATALCARGMRDLGHAIGRAYAVNTLGAILGSIGCGFVLIPLLGMQGTLTALILLNGASAVVLALAMGGSRVRRVGVGAAMAAMTLVGVALIPSDIFRKTFVRAPETLAYYAEGATDTVGVVEIFGQRFIRYEDMRGTAGTLSLRYNYFFGHFPMLLHPGTPRRVLHICFGVGNSLSAVIRHDELERVDNVELSPHVVEAAPFFWTNNNVIESPKVRTIIDDGRNYIMATRETYDVIALEPPETFTAGVINLYTREFYQDAFERLAPDGIMMQWIPTGEAPLDDERTLFRAFSDVFPHVTVWKQINSGCMLLIGMKQPLTIDYQRLIARMKAPAIARDMELIGIQDADHLLSYLIFDEAGVAEFVRDVEPVTDDHTVLDFTIPRSLGSGFGLGTWNTKAVADGRNPWSEAFARERYYLDHRRPVVPLLRNLGSDSPEAVGLRIAERAKIVLPQGGVVREAFRR